MNAEAFRQLYDYHFYENRKLWDNYIVALSQENFTLSSTYSVGSVRDQIMHLIEVDNIWFSELNGLQEPIIPFIDGDERIRIRQQWDAVESMMREYLAALRDETLFTKPILLEEDKDLIVWQVLLHVINHATDHRAQLLRLLNDLGKKTVSQDYIFYVYDNL